MTGTRPSFEELNAYVDNELPAERAADVARAIARDPELARQVAALSRLRAVTAESVEAPVLELPAAPRRPARWLVAACLAGLLIAGAAGLGVMLPERPQSGDWLAAAWQLHDGWTLPEAGSADQALRQPAKFAATYVPDLSASKLALVHVAQRPGPDDGPALVVGYRGTRGCKVTLVIAAAGGPLEAPPGPVTRQAKLTHAWRSDAFAYVLMAEGMDPKRFRLIAESVERASIKRLPFDEETRSALLENRRASKPCLA